MHHFHNANKHRTCVICNLKAISCEQLGLDTHYMYHIYKFSSSYLFFALTSINMATERRSIIIFDETVQANLKSSGISRIVHVTIGDFDRILYWPVVPASLNTHNHTLKRIKVKQASLSLLYKLIRTWGGWVSQTGGYVHTEETKGRWSWRRPRSYTDCRAME